MPSSNFRILLALSLLLFMATGCAISKRVKPVPAGTKIQAIYIVENPDTLYRKSLLEEMQSIINATGCQAVIVTNLPLYGVQHSMLYRANWQWDLAMYLTYFQATLYDESGVIGEVEYDARAGGGRLDKFGTTAGIIRPLLQQMLKEVDHTAGSTSPGDTTTTPSP